MCALANIEDENEFTANYITSYSVRKAVTGFRIAALIVCELTAAKAIASDTIKLIKKIEISIFVLYAKLFNQSFI